MRPRHGPLNGPVETIHDCAFNWAVTFQYEALFKLEGNQQAVESFRNETVKRQDYVIQLAASQGRLVDASGQD